MDTYNLEELGFRICEICENIDSYVVKSRIKYNPICKRCTTLYTYKRNFSKCIDCGKQLTYYSGKRCRECDVIHKKEIGFYKIKVKDKFCIDCGNKIKNKYIKKTIRCKSCHFKYNRGKNHVSWNHNKSDEERLPRREITEFRIWSRQIKELYNFRCFICGDSNHGLESHHLFNWSKYVDLRFNLDNGVCLCKKHHREFHKKYGYDNNYEQFEKFLEKIR